MQSIPLSRANSQKILGSTIAFAVGASLIAIPLGMQYSTIRYEVTVLEQKLADYQTRLQDAQAEVDQIKPQLAHYLIREQARLDHAKSMRQDWSSTFGYTNAVQVKSPEQIAYPNRDLDQMVNDLVRLSDSEHQPMNALVQQVVKGSQ